MVSYRQLTELESLSFQTLASCLKVAIFNYYFIFEFLFTFILPYLLIIYHFITADPMARNTRCTWYCLAWDRSEKIGYMFCINICKCLKIGRPSCKGYCLEVVDLDFYKTKLSCERSHIRHLVVAKCFKNKTSREIYYNSFQITPNSNLFIWSPYRQ